MPPSVTLVSPNTSQCPPVPVSVPPVSSSGLPVSLSTSQSHPVSPEGSSSCLSLHLEAPLQ